MKKGKGNCVWWSLLVVLICIFMFGTIIYLKYWSYEGLENQTSKYLDGVDIVYWINLDRSKDRRSAMEKLLKDDSFDGIPNKRIQAFDGKQDPNSVFDKLIIQQKKHSDSEYGCLVSHLEAIRTFNESDKNVALIFEDDITLEFKKYWTRSVKEIINDAPYDWEIIMLGYNIPNKNTLFYDWSKSDKKYDEFEDNYYGSFSYIINKKGSNKLMQMYSNNKYTLNQSLSHTSDNYIYKVLKTYAYKYPMFIYNTNGQSTIHQDHVASHILSKNNVISNYEKLLNGKN